MIKLTHSMSGSKTARRVQSLKPVERAVLLKWINEYPDEHPVEFGKDLDEVLNFQKAVRVLYNPLPRLKIAYTRKNKVYNFSFKGFITALDVEFILRELRGPERAIELAGVRRVAVNVPEGELICQFKCGRSVSRAKKSKGYKEDGVGRAPNPVVAKNSMSKVPNVVTSVMTLINRILFSMPNSVAGSVLRMTANLEDSYYVIGVEGLKFLYVDFLYGAFLSEERNMQLSSLVMIKMDLRGKKVYFYVEKPTTVTEAQNSKDPKFRKKVQSAMDAWGF